MTVYTNQDKDEGNDEGEEVGQVGLSILPVALCHESNKPVRIQAIITNDLEQLWARHITSQGGAQSGSKNSSVVQRSVCRNQRHQLIVTKFELKLYCLKCMESK